MRGDSDGIGIPPTTASRTEMDEDPAVAVVTNQGSGCLAGSDPPPGVLPGGARVVENLCKDFPKLPGQEESWISTISRIGAIDDSPVDLCMQYLQTQGIQGDATATLYPSSEYAPLKGQRWYLGLSISGFRGEFLVDTGASHTLVGREFMSRLGPSSDVSLAGIRARTATGDTMQTYGRTVKNISVDGKRYWICPTIADITDDGILGMDFAALYGVTMNTRTGKLQIDNPYKHTVQCVLRMSSATSSVVQTTKLLAGHVSDVLVSCVGVQSQRRAVFEPDQSMLDSYGLEGYDTYVANARWTVVPMCNPTAETIVLERGTPIGTTSLAVGRQLDVRDSLGTSSVEMPLPTVEGNPTEGLPLHILSLITDSDLTEVEARVAIDRLHSVQSAFSAPGEPLGRTDRVRHKVDTGDVPPVKLPYRRLPIAKKSAMEEEVDSMLRENIIQPSESPWSSPVVMVTKKDGSCRFCIDYRKLNGVTRKNAYPLPRIDECLESLGGSKWFCTLDLQSGYWQIGMDPIDREKTAFATHMGLYEFNVMPFGLCNAPATFEAMMETMLRGLLWKKCLVYLDDIIVYGSTFKQCLSNLLDVLRKLQSYGLKLKPTKCKLFRKEVEYLGRIVSGHGIKADPTKVMAVEKWPLPTDIREIRSFIGFCSYYRDFIPNFSRISAPLQALMIGEKKSKAKVDLTDGAIRAFNELKRLFTETPVLHYPAPEGKYILDTDASNESIGAALSQVQDGIEVPLAFASNSLSKAQRNYCTTKRELLAVVVYTKKYRHFLFGGDFVLRTDHSALQWLLNFKDAEGMMGRWLNHLSEFGVSNQHMEHRSGVKHINADSLSRIPVRLCQRLDCTDCGSHNAVVASVGVKIPNWTLYNIGKEQQEDVAVSKVYSWKLLNQPKPARPTLSIECKEVRSLVAQWDDLFIHDGVLSRWRYRPGRKKVMQIVVPEAYRLEIMDFCHGHRTSAHFGRERTELKIKSRYYWPGMTADIRRWVKHCPQCCLANPGPGLGKLPLSQEIFGVRFARIAIDIISGFVATPRGNTCMMVVSDYYSKYTQIYPLANHTAITCATALYEQWVLTWGAPLMLHSDQGPEFESRLWSEMCAKTYICKTHTNPYRPQSDGMVERFNRTLIKCLTTMVNDHRDDWDEHARYVAHAYNATEHASTGCTPNLLVLGEEIIMPADMVYGVQGLANEQPCTVMFVEALRQTLREAYSLVRDRLEKSATLQKVGYDTNLKSRRFTPGDVVIRFSTPQSNEKANYNWDGPHLVTCVLNESTVVIKAVASGKVRKSHVARLRSWLGRPEGKEALPIGTLPTAPAARVVPATVKTRKRRGLGKKTLAKLADVTSGAQAPVGTVAKKGNKEVLNKPPTGKAVATVPLSRAERLAARLAKNNPTDAIPLGNASGSLCLAGPLRRSVRVIPRVRLKKRP